MNEGESNSGEGRDEAPEAGVGAQVPSAGSGGAAREDGDTAAVGGAGGAAGAAGEEHDHDPAPEITRADVDACNILRWYESFKQVAIRTKLLHPVPVAFHDYLHADGVLLPEHTDASGVALSPADPRSAPVRAGTDFDADFDEVESSAHDDDDAGGTEDAAAVALPDLDRLIHDTIASFGGATFPKLNWSSAQDASWVSGTVKCTTPGDVYMLLKSSDLIGYDLDHAYDKCSDGTGGIAPGDLCLALRKWCNLYPAQEWRCFVHGDRLIGMCQRNCRQYFDFLAAQADDVCDRLCRFFDKHIRGRFARRNYVFDVYEARNKRVWLLDFNVFGGDTDPLLFRWGELTALAAEAEADGGAAGVTLAADVELRIVESEGGIVFKRHAHHALPEDIFDLSNPEAIERAVEAMRNLESGAAADSSSDEGEDA